MYLIWTDGACKGNPGPMGIGVMIQNDDTEILAQFSKHLGHGTNNIAELTAIKLGLEKAKELGLKDVIVCTDSQYSIGVLSLNWKAKANQQLIMDIKKLILTTGLVKFQHVKGHSNNICNDVVDRLASNAADGTVVDMESYHAEKEGT